MLNFFRGVYLAICLSPVLLDFRLTNSVKPMMRTDNRYVENINERCRPSNIAILYNNLESQEWVDAKESLEDAGFDDEVTITKFLCSVLMVRQISFL